MWGEHYDMARSDLLTVQDRIASSIAEALKIQMTAAERDRLFRRYTENAAAYELYLQGRAQLPRYTPDALRGAIAGIRSGPCDRFQQCAGPRWDRARRRDDAPSIRPLVGSASLGRPCGA